jgi:hypothetical protein
MNSHFQAGDPGALLRERLEALVSQLAELEKLRERVGREESRQRELRKAAGPLAHFGPRAAVLASQRQSSCLRSLVPIGPV